MDNFTVIFPTYNEEEGIANVLMEFETNISQLENDYELIVVNDGSTDNTHKISNEIEGIKVISHESNRGYGAALKTGINGSRYNNIVIIDSDGTYPSEMIDKMAELYLAENLDMVVGARTGPNANIPMERRPAKYILGLIANFLSGQKIPDLNSGFRIMKKDVVHKYLQILPDGFSFTTTITLAMLLGGHSVKFLVIPYVLRKGKSKFSPIKDTFNFFQLIIRTILYFEPLKIFIPLTLLLILIAFTTLITSYLFFDKLMDVTFGVMIISSMITFAVGILADLINRRTK